MQEPFDIAVAGLSAAMRGSILDRLFSIPYKQYQRLRKDLWR